MKILAIHKKEDGWWLEINSGTTSAMVLIQTESSIVLECLEKVKEPCPPWGRGSRMDTHRMCLYHGQFVQPENTHFRCVKSGSSLEKCCEHSDGSNCFWRYLPEKFRLKEVTPR